MNENGFALAMRNESDTYTILECHARRINVAEYAAMHNTREGTVRQWIRRGKFRTAIKQNANWLISELSEEPKRGFKDGTYRIASYDLVEQKYNFLCGDCNELHIMQNEKDKKEYLVELYRDPAIDPYEIVAMSENEKDMFEVFCIVSPGIEYVPKTEGNALGVLEAFAKS